MQAKGNALYLDRGFLVREMPMIDSIEVGDVVQRKAGGPLLTVERLFVDGGADRAICVKKARKNSISKIEHSVEALKKFDPRFLQLTPAFF
jgi:hypothetical protein